MNAPPAALLRGPKVSRPGSGVPQRTGARRRREHCDARCRYPQSAPQRTTARSVDLCAAGDLCGSHREHRGLQRQQWREIRRSCVDACVCLIREGPCNVTDIRGDSVRRDGRARSDAACIEMFGVIVLQGARRQAGHLLRMARRAAAESRENGARLDKSREGVGLAIELVLEFSCVNLQAVAEPSPPLSGIQFGNACET